MTPEQFIWWLGTRIVAIAVAVYLLHRLALWLEARGYIYYRNKQPTGSGMTNAALDFERLIRPSVEHHVAAQDEQIETDENDGE